MSECMREVLAHVSQHDSVDYGELQENLEGMDRDEIHTTVALLEYDGVLYTPTKDRIAVA